LTNLADRRCIFSSKSQSLAKTGSQTGAAYSKVERTNVMYALSLSFGAATNVLPQKAIGRITRMI